MARHGQSQPDTVRAEFIERLSVRGSSFPNKLMHAFYSTLPLNPVRLFLSSTAVCNDGVGVEPGDEGPTRATFSYSPEQRAQQERNPGVDRANCARGS
jgi:hypothetical protein